MAEIKLSYPEDEAYWQSIYQSEVGKPQSWIDAARPLVGSSTRWRHFACR